MENNVPHRTYLVTYSQLDYRKFLTRWSFGGAVVAAFSANNVNYFVAAKENHETSSTGYHHHVAVCIIKPMRWKTAKSYIFENYGATVNFATSSDMDVAAYRCVAKYNKMPFIGNVLKKYPDLEIISTTCNRAILANATFRKNRLQLNEHSHQPKNQNQKKMKKVM